jgi:hypothetical protein
MTGSLILSSSNATELTVIGNSEFTGAVNITGSLTVNGTSIGSFATTGSNSFFGTNTFSGSVAFTGSAPTILSSSFSGSLITNLTDIYTDVDAVQQIVTLSSASFASLLSGSLTNPNTLYIVSGSSGPYATLGANTFTGNQTISGSLNVSGSVNFATGSNQQAGTAVLDGANPGTVTVSNSLVTANSIIMVSKQTLTHTNGYVAVSSKGAGTFTITSNHNGDTDVVGWFIINNS